MPTLVFNLEDRSPFEKTLVLSKGATLPALDIQILDGSGVVDLTGGAVTFSMDDDEGVAKITNAAATLPDATNGKARYSWASVDVDTEDTFFGQFKVVISGSQYLLPNNTDQKLRIIVGPVV